MEIKDRFYKSTEVAEILGVSLRTLYRYMDSGKIDSVQLPSGRHRFTKKQIEGFLYSNGSGVIKSGEGSEPAEEIKNKINVNTKSIGVDDSSSSDETQSSQQSSSSDASTKETSEDQDDESDKTVESEDDELEEELEELLRSLEEDDDDDEDEESTDIDLDSSSTREANSILDEVEDEKEEKSKSSSIADDQQIDENEVKYFYCPYNELKHIANLVKSTASEHDKEYAFTMNAGLSLFFPLDPFSVIHFYVKSEDLDFWKENLQLKESTKSDANIGVLLTNGNALKNLKEVSGLKVVSKEVLIGNLKANGQDKLAETTQEKL